MRRRSTVVLLACVAVALVTGQLRPTNEDGFTHGDPRIPPVVFQVDPSVTMTTTAPVPSP